MDMYIFGAGTLYLVLQLAALAMLNGRMKRIAWGCAAAMALAILIGLAGGYSGSGMAPVWIVIAFPLLAVVLAVLLTIRAVRWLAQ